jgi:hypothetical protein
MSKNESTDPAQMAELIAGRIVGRVARAFARESRPLLDKDFGLAHRAIYSELLDVFNGAADYKPADPMTPPQGTTINHPGKQAAGFMSKGKGGK